MEKRKLGTTGFEVAPLAFGGNVFGWTADETTSFALLDAFIDAGFNLIDTADVYSRWASGNKGGESEVIIGKWLRRSGNREKVVLVTKVGMEMGPGEKGLGKNYILKEVEESLRRLQTDRIDLYLSHSDDPETPLDETLEACAQLIDEGKVRTVGASNYSAERLAEALRVSEETGLPAYRVLEPLYNLYDRAEYESGLQVLCREKGLGVITYFSLASGFLTGKYHSQEDLAARARGSFVSKYLTERGFRIIGALETVAAETNATAAQVALAWLMARPGVTAPIASATSVKQLQELMGAAELKLDDGAMELLNQTSAE